MAGHCVRVADRRLRADQCNTIRVRRGSRSVLPDRALRGAAQVIGFIVRDGKWLLKASHDGTTDPLQAVRFAREEDAHAWMIHYWSDEKPEHRRPYDIVPILMSPQWPCELRMVRDAISEADALQVQADALKRRSCFQTHSWKTADTRARMAMVTAKQLAYELFKRAMLRDSPTPAKVALPAKAQGLQS